MDASGGSKGEGGVLAGLTAVIADVVAYEGVCALAVAEGEEVFVAFGAVVGFEVFWDLEQLRAILNDFDNSS